MEGVSLPESLSPPVSARAHDVVILRESEVGDLGHAIRRVRAAAATAHSQILIIAPEADSASGEVACELASVAARARGQAATSAIRQLAAGVEPLVADLGLLLDESEREVSSLADEVGEGTRARLKHRATVLGEIIQWIRAVAIDLGACVQTALAGRRQVDLMELWHEVVADVGVGLGVQFVVENEGSALRQVEVDPVATADLLTGCARLLAARLGHHGTVRVQFRQTAARTTVSLCGFGASHPLRAKELVARVRELAATVGAELSAGAGGPARGTGLAVAFPLPPI